MTHGHAMTIIRILYDYYNITNDNEQNLFRNTINQQLSQIRSFINQIQWFQNAVNKQEENATIKRAANEQQTFNKRSMNGTQFDQQNAAKLQRITKRRPNGIQG